MGLSTTSPASGDSGPSVALWLPASRFSVVSGSVNLTQRNRLPVWSFDQTATEGVATGIDLAYEGIDGWATADVVAVWTNGGAGSGDVGWRVDITQAADAEAIANPPAGTLATITAPAQDVQKFSVIASGIAIADAGDILTLSIWRIANDAGDTLANDAALIGIRLARVS